MTDEEVFELLPITAKPVTAVRGRDAARVAECFEEGRADVLAVILAGMHWGSRGGTKRSTQGSRQRESV
ncbi:hypothetical protein [Leucobacter luti]|uniref:hypothetical protein n=1 Tax=Leucobacter luti TaxID=340320 RepID=UPI001C68CFC2|nr:hypothetical protein [Leucobacter luti]QYM75592.1 hypothetical protein K1X41_13370 [Leucobacter luti]